MTIAALKTILLAPAKTGGGFHISTTLLLIIGIVVGLGILFIIGWREPDRTPHAEEKAEIDRIED
jgi:hypothetical protein